MITSTSDIKYSNIENSLNVSNSSIDVSYGPYSIPYDDNTRQITIEKESGYYQVEYSNGITTTKYPVNTSKEYALKLAELVLKNLLNKWIVGTSVGIIENPEESTSVVRYTIQYNPNYPKSGESLILMKDVDLDDINNNIKVLNKKTIKLSDSGDSDTLKINIDNVISKDNSGTEKNLSSMLDEISSSLDDKLDSTNFQSDFDRLFDQKDVLTESNLDSKIETSSYINSTINSRLDSRIPVAINDAVSNLDIVERKDITDNEETIKLEQLSKLQERLSNKRESEYSVRSLIIDDDVYNICIIDPYYYQNENRYSNSYDKYRETTTNNIANLAVLVDNIVTSDNDTIHDNYIYLFRSNRYEREVNSIDFNNLKIPTEYTSGRDNIKELCKFSGASLKTSIDKVKSNAYWSVVYVETNQDNTKTPYLLTFSLTDDILEEYGFISKTSGNVDNTTKDVIVINNRVSFTDNGITYKYSILATQNNSQLTVSSGLYKPYINQLKYSYQYFIVDNINSNYDESNYTYGLLGSLFIRDNTDDNICDINEMYYESKLINNVVTYRLRDSFTVDNITYHTEIGTDNSIIENTVNYYTNRGFGDIKNIFLFCREDTGKEYIFDGYVYYNGVKKLHKQIRIEYSSNTKPLILKYATESSPIGDYKGSIVKEYNNESITTSNLTTNYIEGYLYNTKEEVIQYSQEATPGSINIHIEFNSNPINNIGYYSGESNNTIPIISECNYSSLDGSSWNSNNTSKLYSTYNILEYKRILENYLLLNIDNKSERDNISNIIRSLSIIYSKELVSIPSYSDLDNTSDIFNTIYNDICSKNCSILDTLFSIDDKGYFKYIYSLSCFMRDNLKLLDNIRNSNIIYRYNNIIDNIIGLYNVIYGFNRDSENNITSNLYTILHIEGDNNTAEDFISKIIEPFRSIDSEDSIVSVLEDILHSMLNDNNIINNSTYSRYFQSNIWTSFIDSNRGIYTGRGYNISNNYDYYPEFVDVIYIFLTRYLNRVGFDRFIQEISTILKNIGFRDDTITINNITYYLEYFNRYYYMDTYYNKYFYNNYIYLTPLSKGDSFITYPEYNKSSNRDNYSNYINYFTSRWINSIRVDIVPKLSIDIYQSLGSRSNLSYNISITDYEPSKETITETRIDTTNPKEGSYLKNYKYILNFLTKNVVVNGITTRVYKRYRFAPSLNKYINLSDSIFTNNLVAKFDPTQMSDSDLRSVVTELRGFDMLNPRDVNNLNNTTEKSNTGDNSKRILDILLGSDKDTIKNTLASMNINNSFLVDTLSKNYNNNGDNINSSSNTTSTDFNTIISNIKLINDIISKQSNSILTLMNKTNQTLQKFDNNINSIKNALNSGEPSSSITLEVFNTTDITTIIPSIDDSGTIQEDTVSTTTTKDSNDKDIFQDTTELPSNYKEPNWSNIQSISQYKLDTKI